MDCLNRLEIQKYIDGEVSRNEMKSFIRHISKCEHCRDLWNDARLEVQKVNELIGMMNSENESPSAIRKNSNRNIIILTAAAAGLLLTLIIQYRFIQIRNENIMKSNLQVQKLLNDLDPNTMWNEKQTIIIVTDKNGNLIDSEF